ncbi:hypothetical protein ATI61_112262 [Archangium gephyra]|uniref:Uncharacterized protein n=1 Tax=Archangium gephyra TaxID=48 RepID=A0AAC8TCM5_9BACT|nr:hypothetical protein [Archangium gephyra]AKJ01003.1 Hypothetical protein AA314_02629 [Archangium gephyra]REG26167.1 hypothetical protein ATI61_112262 [Archangium gephyra]
MAEKKTWKGGRLGPFHLGKRYKNVGTDLGRLYAAHDVDTGNAALVVMPADHADLESWRVRATSQAEPPYLALEVEQAPASGRLPDLSNMLDLLTSAVERLEKNEEARAHLTGGAVISWKRWVGRMKRLLRSPRGLLVAGLLTPLILGVLFWPRVPGNSARPDSETRASTGVGTSAMTVPQAPTLVDLDPSDVPAITYPLPARPFSDQAKVPCFPKSGEVEINGGCWVALEKRPPCYENQAEHQGKCYMPVSAKSHEKKRREPHSVQP